jgi:CheY-like chemotaxis protein
MMERQVGQMVRLVDDLLDVNRITQGKFELRRGRVELASAVNHAVEAARSLYASHKLLVTLPEQAINGATSLAMLLNLTGNETHTAFDGLEAVEAAVNLRPEVVLLDIGLPNLNGYEVCRRIRRQPGGKRMLLVALTGWGQEEDRQMCRDAGFNSHPVKPVELPALMKLLAKFQSSPT